MIYYEADGVSGGSTDVAEQVTPETPEQETQAAVEEVAKYTDKQLNDLIAKNSDKEVKKLLGKYGLESTEQLAAVIEADKKRKEADMTAEERARQIEKDAEEKIATAQRRADESEAVAEALRLGVDPAKVDRIKKLLPSYEGESVSERVGEILKDIPELIKKAGSLGLETRNQNLNAEEEALAKMKKAAGLA